MNFVGNIEVHSMKDFLTVFLQGFIQALAGAADLVCFRPGIVGFKGIAVKRHADEQNFGLLKDDGLHGRLLGEGQNKLRACKSITARELLWFRQGKTRMNTFASPYYNAPPCPSPNAIETLFAEVDVVGGEELAGIFHPFWELGEPLGYAQVAHPIRNRHVRFQIEDW